MLTTKALLTRAKQAKKESKHLDFKAQLDVASKRDWCEIVKDIVAMANSGGGCILFGVRDDASASAWDVAPLLAMDPATITDKVAHYTGEQFSEFEIRELRRANRKTAALIVQSSPVPLVFIKPGTYEESGNKQGRAFSVGQVYFRHGAKSEPGTTQDLRNALDRELVRRRRSLLGGIRKVVQAPAGYSVRVLPPEVVESTGPTALPIRITDNPAAPAYRKLDTNVTHPFRLKELQNAVSAMLGNKPVGTHDLQCVRRVHGIDGKSEFAFRPKYGTPQFSTAYRDWVVARVKADPKFFEKARAKYKAQQEQYKSMARRQ